jgi:hypothetical protein
MSRSQTQNKKKSNKSKSTKLSKNIKNQKGGAYDSPDDNSEILMYMDDSIGSSDKDIGRLDTDEDLNDGLIIDLNNL